MNPAGAAPPRATIVMTARERHSLAEASIESVVADTAQPYRFMYLDVESPGWLRATLAQRAAEWGLDVVRFDEPLWPQEARRRVACAIDTDYVVFVDNDVQVEPGWLEALVACADETGAGIVGPLYLWGDGVASPKIHMAGGKLFESQAAGGRVLDEQHHLINADPRLVAGQLFRQPCDFVEFHCMLIRTSLLRDPAFLDPAIRCAHEHIDVALAAAQRGFAVWFEPASRVHYMAFSDYMLDDLSFFRERWSAAEGEASIAAFSSKWNVIDDERSFGGVRKFLRTHLAQVDPLRQSNPAGADRQARMRADELVQSRSGLFDLALARGYQPDEIATIAEAYSLAQRLTDGGYRPCGRPFINHLVGTAGVLVRYDFSADLVAAGLLHAAYTHAPPHANGPEAAAVAVSAALGGDGGGVERRVRAYALRESGGDGPAPDPELFATLSVFEAEIIAIEAANEVDMLLSGEFRYSGRTDALDPDEVLRIGHVCRILDVTGLAATLASARDEQVPAPDGMQTGIHGSYRFGPDQRSPVSMVSGAPLSRRSTAS